MVGEADVDGGLLVAKFPSMLRSSILAAAVLSLGGCSDSCSNRLIGRADAPDEQRTAILFQRDCGATTSFSTQVSVVTHGSQSPKSGNAFRADDNHGAAAAGNWGGPWAEIKWLAADHLQIRYARQSRVFEQAEHVSGVRISYQQVDR